LLGTVFMGIISNVMVLSRVSGYWQEIILGAILILAIWFDIVVQKRSPLTRAASQWRTTRPNGGIKKTISLLFPLWAAAVAGLGGWALSSCEGPPRDKTAAKIGVVNEADYAMTEAPTSTKNTSW
jgi:ribose transport system permease protein